MAIMREFKSFALKGNVIDLAVGVIIGSQFNNIVQSLVGDIIMPVFSPVTGHINFAELAIQFDGAKINYGKFIQASFTFLIIAFSLFLIIQGINRMKRKEEAKPPAQQSVPEDIKLLTEIRDELKNLGPKPS